MLINQYVNFLFDKLSATHFNNGTCTSLFLVFFLLFPGVGLGADIESNDLKLPPVEVVNKKMDRPKEEQHKKVENSNQEENTALNDAKVLEEKSELVKREDVSEPEIDKDQEDNLQALKPKRVSQDDCGTTLVSQDLEKKYLVIQKRLESDFKRGMPKQLRTDLVRVRTDIDDLIGQLFEVDDKNTQEVNHIVQLTIDYLEKMISLLPKANKIAPMVRDRYVIPFTNISSIKAEHQECLMRSAVAEVKEKNLALDDQESSINIYRKLTNELKNLNQNLYTLQTTDVQKFINFRADLLYKLEKFNQKTGQGSQVTANIPKILNSVHNEIERLLPGLQLSENFYSTFD